MFTNILVIDSPKGVTTQNVKLFSKIFFYKHLSPKLAKISILVQIRII